MFKFLEFDMISTIVAILQQRIMSGTAREYYQSLYKREF